MRKWSFSRTGGYRKRVDTSVRSNYEGRIKKNLEKDNVKFQYEPVRIPYCIEHTYKPDFVLDNNIMVEAKGLFESKDRTKHLAVKKQHPHLDIRFLFMQDNKLRKGGKTRYSDWCTKHGFKYAFGDKVPLEWINERKTEEKK